MIKATKELLHELYWGQGLSVHDIEKRLGYKHNALQTTFKNWGIPRRTRKEAFQVALKQGKRMKEGLKPRKGEDNLYPKAGLFTI